MQRERRRIQVSAEEIGPLCLEKVSFAVAVAGSVWELSPRESCADTSHKKCSNRLGKDLGIYELCRARITQLNCPKPGKQGQESGTWVKSSDWVASLPQCRAPRDCTFQDAFYLTFVDKNLSDFTGVSFGWACRGFHMKERRLNKLITNGVWEELDFCKKGRSVGKTSVIF